MSILELILGILFATTAVLTAPDEATRQRLEAQLTPAALTLNVACEYGSWMLTTIGHEYGHALAIKAFKGTLPAIHLGTHDPQAAPLFSIGNLHINGLDPLLGHTEMPTIDRAQLAADVEAQLARNPALRNNLEKVVQDAAQKLKLSDNQLKTTLLAGGLTGAATRLAMQALTRQPLHLDALVSHQLCNALLPLNEEFDAAKLWKLQFNLSDKQMSYLSILSMAIYVYLYVHTTVHDPRNHKATPRETLLLLGLANYYLRGMARFHG